MVYGVKPNKDMVAYLETMKEWGRGLERYLNIEELLTSHTYSRTSTVTNSA